MSIDSASERISVAIIELEFAFADIQFRDKGAKITTDVSVVNWLQSAVQALELSIQFIEKYKSFYNNKRLV